jgi:two-component system, response regulator PdtaR
MGSMSNSRTKEAVVLVVEDEILIRMMAVDLVEMAGFEAVEAANADEAISILEGRSDISVVFTDIHMPGSIDGLKLAHFVRRRWPPIELIVTSALFDVPDEHLPTRGVFLPKPYNAEQVVATLQRLAA